MSPASVSGDLEHLRSHVLVDVSLAAVLTHLSRDLVDNDGLSIAMERDRGSSWPALSVVTNDALHRLIPAGLEVRLPQHRVGLVRRLDDDLVLLDVVTA